MNKYIFLNQNDIKGPALYQVSASTIEEAIHIYLKANNLSISYMEEAVKNNLLTLFSMVSSESKGYLSPFDLLNYLENLDKEIFLKDPYKYIIDLLEIKEKPKIQDSYFLNYNLSSSYFNYLLRYLIYRIPDNHLVIKYHLSTNTLSMPEFSTEPLEENPSNINRVYSLDYVPYLTIHILVYKD